MANSASSKPTAIAQAGVQGMRRRWLSHCTTGQRMAARRIAMVSGTKMESPSHSAMAAPSNPRQFKPMRVACERSRLIIETLDNDKWRLPSHLTGNQRVVQQHCDGHGADAAGYGGNRAGDIDRGGEIHVADWRDAVGHTIDAHVDNGRAGLDHVGFDEARLADGGDEDVGDACD